MSANVPAVAVPQDTSLVIPAHAYVERLAAWCEARALFIVAVSAVLILSLAGIPSHFAQDGWLALIGGRLIAAHGIPQYDYFTHMAYGVRWTDQQWLAQLVMYLLENVGGMQLLTVAYVFITGGAFAAGIKTARKLGAQDLHVLAMLPVGAFFYLATAVSIRTQGFAYPLFMATLYLLATDIRAEPKRRTYWVIPILIVWANLHGSVTMGIGLSVIYGFSYAIKRVRADGLKAAVSARAAAFVLLAPLTLFATPYGTSMVHYYSVTLLNPEFNKLVIEWKPVSSIPILAVPLLVVIAGTLCTFARAWRRAWLFDALTLLMLAIGAVMAVRNVTWFGLAAVALLPPAVSSLKHGRPAPLRRTRVNQLFAIAMVALTVFFTITTLARPTNWFTSNYPSSSVGTLKRLVAHEPNVKIFADVHYADWLIWEDPQLFSGRVAYDTSLELLTDSQLKQISVLVGKQSRSRVPNVLRPYGIWMLSPGNRTGNATLLDEPGVRLVLKNKQAIIATHPTGSGV